jgi:hypothetical protein
MNIETRVEAARGCGYRHTGPNGVGLYLVGSPFCEVCERLPYPLTVCPCCGQGYKYSRAMGEIDPRQMFEGPPGCAIIDLSAPLSQVLQHHHHDCYMCDPATVASGWLSWVGRQFYSPVKFLAEATERGVSRRLAQLPRGFVPGKSVVYLAHLDAIPPWSPRHPEHVEGENGTPDTDRKPAPGVFSVFRPSLEVVVDTTDPDQAPAYAHELADRWQDAVTVVRVIPERDPVQAELLEEQTE